MLNILVSSVIKKYAKIKDKPADATLKFVFLLCAPNKKQEIPRRLILGIGSNKNMENMYGKLICLFQRPFKSVIVISIFLFWKSLDIIVIDALYLGVKQLSLSE